MQQRIELLDYLRELYQEGKWDEVLSIIQGNNNYRPEYEFDPFNMTQFPPFNFRIIDFEFPPWVDWRILF